MAYAALVTIQGNPNTAHRIRVDYDLISSTATTFTIDIRLSYILMNSSAHLQTSSGFDGSVADDAPFIRFSTESNDRYYARASVTGGDYREGYWEHVIYEHRYSNITRNGNSGSFTLTISGRERLINSLSNSPLVNRAWSGTITIPASVYTVTYNKNYSPAESTSRTINQGTTHYLISCPWSRTGYDFLYWNTKSDGTGTNYAAGTGVTSARTLYARWTPHEYTITYHRNFTSSDTNVATSPATYGQNHTLISLATAGWSNHDGRIFLGWGKSKTATTYYAPGSTQSTSGNVDYYAIWQLYTVRISNGENFDDQYIPYIYTTYDGVTKWWPHQAYIYNGSAWEPYGG